MAEYIERETAEKVASRYGCANGAAIGKHSGLADCIASEIAELPAADVAPVVHAYWEWRSKDQGYFCSHCGSGCLLNRESDWCKSDRCPHCGAMMDLEAPHG